MGIFCVHKPGFLMSGHTYIYIIYYIHVYMFIITAAEPVHLGQTKGVQVITRFPDF